MKVSCEGKYSAFDLNRRRLDWADKIMGILFLRENKDCIKFAKLDILVVLGEWKYYQKYMVSTFKFT